MIGRAGPGGQTLRVFGVDRQFRLGDRRLKHLGRAGGRDVLQGVEHDLGRRFLAQLVNQALDLLVVLCRRPGDDLIRLGSLRELGIGKRLPQETKSIQRTSPIHPFHRVDHRFGRRFGVAFYVDLPENRVDHLVLGWASPGGQSLRVSGVHAQLGHRNRRCEHLHGTLGRNVLHRVHGCLRLGGRWALIHLVDQRLDFYVVLDRGPGDYLARLRPHGELRFRERGAQEVCGVGGKTRVHAFQRVDDDFRRRLLAHLFDKGLDLFVILCRRPRHHLVRLGALGEARVGERAHQETKGVEDVAGIHSLKRVDARS